MDSSGGELQLEGTLSESGSWENPIQQVLALRVHGSEESE